jgi:hypothetical protein
MVKRQQLYRCARAMLMSYMIDNSFLGSGLTYARVWGCLEKPMYKLTCPKTSMLYKGEAFPLLVT